MNLECASLTLSLRSTKLPDGDTPRTSQPSGETGGCEETERRKKVKRKLNLSPERRAQLAAAMKARGRPESGCGGESAKHLKRSRFCAWIGSSDLLEQAKNRVDRPAKNQLVVVEVSRLPVKPRKSDTAAIAMCSQMSAWLCSTMPRSGLFP